MLQSEGVGLMVWSPLAGGLLQRQVRPRREQAEAGSRRAAFDFPPVDKERAYDSIDVDARDRRASAASRSRRSRSPGCCTSRR